MRFTVPRALPGAVFVFEVPAYHWCIVVADVAGVRCFFGGLN